MGSIPDKQEDFLRWLDRKTEQLRKRFPQGGQRWGPARKAINVFLRLACYNVYMREKHQLDAVEAYLEVPLDSTVAKTLATEAGRGVLPCWRGVKNLDAQASQKYQAFAQEYAAQRRIPRVHLDPLIYGGGW